jgi:acyl carrier protein
VPKKDSKGDAFLVSYIVSPQPLNPTKIRKSLSEKIPEYMIPSYFIQVDTIPLTPNKKIDKKALLDLEIQLEGEYEAPKNTLEDELVHIWSEVLNLKPEKISVNANFFEMGGHSIKASILSSIIHKTFDVKISLMEIFRNPTVKEISELIFYSEKETFIDLKNIEKKEYYPLSYNQKRLYVIHRLEPQSTAFNMPGKIELKEAVDEEAIENILAQLVNRHEILRTGFKIVEDEPVQFLKNNLCVQFKKIDLSLMEEAEKAEKRKYIFQEESKRVFNLAEAPLMTTCLVKLNKEESDLIFNIHHIITDGWSMEILKNDFFQCYEALVKGENGILKPTQYQYRDFSEWQDRQIKDDTNRGKAHQYWEDKFNGGNTIFQLAGDYPRNSEDASGAAYSMFILQELTEKLKELAQKNNTTPFMILFTVFLVLLHRLASQEEITCSIINSGREHISINQIMGFFVNSVLFKIELEGEEAFEKLLQRVKLNILEVFKHQNYPVELVFEELNIRYPEVPVSFNMLNLGKTNSQMELKDPEFRHVQEIQDVKFDIEPYVVEYKNGIRMTWNFKKKMFKPETIEYYTREYTKLLDFFTKEPNKEIRSYQGRAKRKSFSRIIK